MVVRLARPDVAGTVLLTVSWFQAVCRSRSACSPGAGGGLVLRAGRRAPSAAHPLDWLAPRGTVQAVAGNNTRFVVPGGRRVFPGLVCVVADGAASRWRLGGCVRPSVACCGVVCLADEVQRHHVQGGELGVRWQELCARQRAPTGEAKDPYVFPLRRDAGSFAASCGVGVAGAAGRRRSCARFISTRSSAPRRNSCSHGIAGTGWLRAIIMSATPPSAKTTPCSERARKQRDQPRNRRHHPQQAAQILQQLRRHHYADKRKQVLHAITRPG